MKMTQAQYESRMEYSKESIMECKEEIELLLKKIESHKRMITKTEEIYRKDKKMKRRNR